MPYDEMMITPMRVDLTRLGIDELKSSGDVESFLAEPGARFVFLNSVCGCAVGQARPGLALALANGSTRPAGLGTVFAGQDLDATARVRENIHGEAPSSPSAALFKDGQMVWFMPRKAFLDSTAEKVAQAFESAFNEHCS